MTGITETQSLVAYSDQVIRHPQQNGRHSFADVMEQKGHSDEGIHTGGQRDAAGEMEKPNSSRSLPSLQEGETCDALVSDMWLNGESEAERLISESGTGALMVSYPFRHLAVGLLDYQKTGSEMTLPPISAAEATETSQNVLRALTGEQNARSIPLTYGAVSRRSGDIYSLWNWIQKNSERSNQVSLNDSEGMNRYVVAPQLSTARTLLSRNISYLRSSDGRTKVVLRDYRADEVSLALWYNQVREQLRNHQGLVINGKDQKSAKVTE